MILSKNIYIYFYNFIFYWFYLNLFISDYRRRLCASCCIQFVEDKFKKKKRLYQEKYYQKLENHIFQLYHSLFSIYSLVQRVISRSSLQKMFNIGNRRKILWEILEYIENNQIIDKTSISSNHKGMVYILVSIISCENNQMLNDGTQNSLYTIS